MALVDPPTIIQAAADKLQACTSFAAEIGSDAMYYPEASGDASTSRCTLQPVSSQSVRIAEGAVALTSGSISAVVELAHGSTIGDAETLAEATCREIIQHQTGLYVSSASWTVAGEPTRGMSASDEESIAIEILINYGVT